MSEAVEKIHPSLLSLVVDIDTLHADPANARKHDEKNIEAIKTSLVKFGMRFPIIVQKDGMIVRAGNGRLEAAKQLGWQKIPAVVVDENNIDATAFGIADNQIATKASWDWGVLADLVKGLKEDDFDIKQLGFEDYEITPLLNADWTPDAVTDEDEEQSGDLALTLKYEGDDKVTVIRAIEKMNQATASAMKNEQAVVAICRRYLDEE